MQNAEINVMTQILSVLIFVAMFVFIIIDKIDRHIVTLSAAALAIIFVFLIGMHNVDALIETINIHSIFTAEFWYTFGHTASAASGINWETIIFIAGMMIMVEGMARVGFFRWLCIKIAQLVNYKPLPIFLMFMLLSAVLAMFIDSITVILFLASATIELAKTLKFNPVPMIMAEIFCANLGGSATMCGDPPNIIIGTSLGYSFGDFIRNTGVIAGIALIATVILFYFVFRKSYTNHIHREQDEMPNPGDAITNRKKFIVSTVIFLIAIVLLVTHAATGLTVSTIGVFIAVLMLLSAGKDALDVLKRVDVKTLLFFVGLFIVVSSLEQTGVLVKIAELISNVSGGNAHIIIAVVLWLSAVASAIVDNIPFAATMLPVIRTLSQTQGIELPVLAWTLAVGTDVGGSATPIGASANVVGISHAKKEGYNISWGQYCKVMIPSTVLTVGIAMIIIFVRYV